MIDNEQDLKTKEQLATDNEMVQKNCESEVKEKAENADGIYTSKDEVNDLQKKPAKKPISDRAKLLIAAGLGFAVFVASVIFGITQGKPNLIKIGSFAGTLIFIATLVLIFVKKAYISHRERIEHNKRVDELRAQRIREKDKSRGLVDEEQNIAECSTEKESNAGKKKRAKDESRLTKAQKIENKYFMLIFGSILLSFVLIIVGSGLAPYYKIGFLLLGLGLATFIGIFVFFLIQNRYERRKYLKYLKLDKSLMKDFYDIKEGIVTKYNYHSKQPKRAKQNRCLGSMFQIYVFPLNEENKNKYKKRKPAVDYKTQPRMLSHLPVEDGDIVRFYQNKKNPKDCYFIARIGRNVYD